MKISDVLTDKKAKKLENLFEKEVDTKTSIDNINKISELAHKLLKEYGQFSPDSRLTSVFRNWEREYGIEYIDEETYRMPVRFGMLVDFEKDRVTFHT